MTAEFSPAWFLPGPHVQTIWGRLTRPRQLVKMRREVLETPDGDELVLDHLDAPVTAAEPLHFVLMHGLEGSSHSVYIQGVLEVIARHGHAATALNFRSCARDPKNIFRMLPNRRPRFYHSGETTDFDFVVRTLSSRHDALPLVGFGASLGGNMLLKWLGENPGQAMVRAAATLSVPYDLGAGAIYLEKSVAGRFYVSRFLATLKKKALRPDISPLVDLPRVLRSRTFREFDDSATAPIHGFVDANDYYARCSSIHFLDRITTPALTLNAEDDPFLPPDVLPRVRAAASPAVDVRTTPSGGHVGFIGGPMPWSCEYWAEELVVRWLVENAKR
jgi:uncharacterized protein